MPSFTSSSDRAPKVGLKTLLLGTAMVTAVCVGAVEMFWRGHDVVPSYDNGIKSWSYIRQKIEASPTKQATVLLGASRMISAVSLAAYREGIEFDRLYQLSVAGEAPLATLKDIAEKTSFSGVVVMALSSHGLYDEAWREQAGHVDYYHRNWGMNNRVNFWFDREAQSRLVSRNPRYGMTSVVRALIEGDQTLFGPAMNVVTEERQRNTDYSQIDIDGYKAARVARASKTAEAFTPARKGEWMANLDMMMGYIRQIEKRGGRVVIVRMPTSEGHWDVDQKALPRAEYWDVLASKHADSLHFMDIPGMADIPLPDSSHVGVQDQAYFTKLLVTAIQDLGVYDGR
ncbi:MAG: hypothetical protein CMF31_03895 [Kordiimonas sp.]|nr:hypothetical protein [Kordiimonas sp.]